MMEPQHGRSPLHQACYKGSLDELSAAIDQGANLEQVNSRGETAAIYLCSKSSFRKREASLLQRLLEAGAKPDSAADSGSACPSALAACVDLGGSWRLKAAEALLSFGADPNRGAGGLSQPPLSRAVNRPWHEAQARIIDLLARHGADLSSEDKRGRSLLLQAAFWGSPRAVLALLERGAMPSDNDLATARSNAIRADSERQCHSLILSWSERKALNRSLTAPLLLPKTPRL